MSTVVNIPVVCVSGLLGSGKSTTVASLLDSRRHGSVGVVVQDLADSNIDTALLQGGETIEATPQFWIEPVVDGVHEAVRALLDRGNFSAIIIETSGAIPVTRVLHEARLHELPAVRYAGCITVLDAQQVLGFDTPESVPEILQDTFRAADLILLNKIDRVPLMQRSGLQAKARNLVRECGGQAPLRATRFGRVSLNELLQSLPHAPTVSPTAVQPGAAPELKHGVFQSHRPFCSAGIYTWLQEITENPPAGLLRAKGFFYVDSMPDYILVFDVVHRHIEIGIEGVWWVTIPAEKRPDDPAIAEALAAGGEFADRKQQLVFIGEDLDIASLQQQLENLLCDEFSPPAEDDPMRGALRKQLAQLKSGRRQKNRRL
ncbi:CobW family GTP-binding protein [Spirochaeta africana]|uniref:Putative GTPase, G3E family n=1 Tax=Spirochaeta africana (strain ATCC 700263 / DSM 8902 / Z-7692) TaxID=889378 RepID=H9UHL1_SPIAZ|nr:GTP-binding protein [Spirochaeta africana]AFG37004.1 putative GTPase, G3E family [Spirochaeta africana DSM 8902]